MTVVAEETSHEPDLNPPEDPPAEITERQSRFPKSVAVLLAALAVTGAMVAVLETYASTSDAHVARETTRTAVQGMATSIEANVLVQLSAELSRGAAGGLDDRAAADSTSLQQEAEYLRLKQAALTETRVGWNNRSSQLGTVLTVLAVAVFLTGFSLVVQRWIRVPLLLPGVLLGVICAGWAAYIYQRGVPQTDDGAIRATAEGIVELERGETVAAKAAFATAIRADDDYSPAYEGRAVAGYLQANPDFLITGSVLEPTSRAVTDALSDLERAIEFGDGHDLYAPTLLGVLRLFSEDPTAAGEDLDRALGVNDAVPELWFARAAVAVAADDLAVADRSLDAGIALLDASEPSTKTRELAAELLAELEWVKATVPGQGVEADRFAARIVALESSFVLGRDLNPADAGDVSLETSDLAIREGLLVVQVAYRDLPADTSVSALVFERARENGAWAHASDLALITTLSGSGLIDESVAITRTCDPIELRLDIYVEGSLAMRHVAPGTAATC